MNGNTDRLSKITNLGIDFNSDLIGDIKSRGFLKQLDEFDSGKEADYWLLLREMGTHCQWLNGAYHKQRYSKDISTIVFGSFFFYNKISFILEQISRITRKQFKYTIIDEFEPLFDPNNKKIDQEFWNELDKLEGKSNYICKYSIMGDVVELDYRFQRWNWTSLNPDFGFELFEVIKKQLSEVNVHCLELEESITFIHCDKPIKNELEENLSIKFHTKNTPIQPKEKTVFPSKEMNTVQPEHEKKDEQKWWQFWK